VSTHRLRHAPDTPAKQDDSYPGLGGHARTPLIRTRGFRPRNYQLRMILAAGRLTHPNIR
jgi:hypothetical protein